MIKGVKLQLEIIFVRKNGSQHEQDEPEKKDHFEALHCQV
jgi:hypothetical protein